VRGASPAIRVGVLGYGDVAAAIHVPNLVRLRGVVVTAIAEPEAARRALAAATLPWAAACGDWREVVARDDVDVVVVCLPTALHADAAIASFAAGRHVYLEKPLAHDAASGARVVEAWRASGRVGMMGFHLRFHPLYERLRDVVAAGGIGPPVAFRSVFSAAGTSLPAWKERRATGGGALLDLASHHVDLVHYLLQRPVEEVSAFVRSHRTEGDTATIQLRLAGDVLAQSFFALDAVEDDSVEVLGRSGRAAVRRYASLDVDVRGRRAAGLRRRQVAGAARALTRLPYAWRKRRSTGHDPAYAAALDRFARAVRGETAPYPDLEDGWRSLLVVEAAEASARSGRAVAPDAGTTR
jgi:predicted dehydrogenase